MTKQHRFGKSSCHENRPHHPPFCMAVIPSLDNITVVVHENPIRSTVSAGLLVLALAPFLPGEIKRDKTRYANANGDANVDLIRCTEAPR